MSNDITRYNTMQALEGLDEESRLAVLAAGWGPRHFAADGKAGEPNEYARHFAKAILKCLGSDKRTERTP